MICLFLVLTIFIQTSFACPNDTISSFNDKTLCYSFQAYETNFMAAESICQSGGGHLTSIHDMFENVFLDGEAIRMFKDKEKNDFWIGANNLKNSGNWSWIDGTLFDFTDWDKGQPQNTSDTNCGAMVLGDSKWIAANCINAKYFVCLIKSQSQTTSAPAATTTIHPKTCDNGWTYFSLTGFCYTGFDNETWVLAEERCTIDRAHLTSIHSSEEALFLANLVYYPGADVCNGWFDALIGLYSDDNLKTWKWTDGTPVDFLNWLPGDPHHSSTDTCGEMMLSSVCFWKAGQFNNLPCDNVAAKYICKKPAE